MSSEPLTNVKIYKSTTFSFVKEESESDNRRNFIKKCCIFSLISILLLTLMCAAFLTVKYANEAQKIENETPEKEIEGVKISNVTEIDEITSDSPKDGINDPNNEFNEPNNRLNHPKIEISTFSTEKNEDSNQENEIQLKLNEISSATEKAISLTETATSVILTALQKTEKPFEPSNDYINYDLPSDIPEEFSTHENFKIFESQNCGKLFAGKRINGIKAEKFEFPWVVALFFYDLNRDVTTFGCGGSLIAKNLVLTAAHCLPSGENSSLQFVRLGEYDMSKSSEDVQDITDFEVVIHPEWNKNKGVNDIALIKLKTPAHLEQENIKTICLPFENEELPSRVIVSGFGSKPPRREIHSDILNKATLDVVSSKKCIEEHKTKKISFPVTENQFCAIGMGEDKKGRNVVVDTCKYDSGSPAQNLGKNGKQTQFGIVSWGEKKPCGENKAPGVYVKVRNYLTWILDNAES